MKIKCASRLMNIFLILALAVILFPVQRVQAQAYSAYDLIAAVNALRAEHGLPAYQVDGGLMGYAQTHTDYMASMGTITHTRADGSRPSDLGVLENVAYGTGVSPSDVIYSYWMDDLHWNTMVGVAGGYVGAGVTQSGDFIYYSLDVRRDSSVAMPQNTPAVGSTPAPGVTPAGGQPQTDIGIPTSTPMSDGTIAHVVQYGQTLWAIAVAYNQTIAQILAGNDLPENTVLREGQVLIIRMANTITPTPTITPTRLPVTRTPTLTATVRTPSATRTPTITVTPTAKPLLPEIELAPRTKQWLGLTMVVICAAGLIFVAAASLIKKK